MSFVSAKASQASTKVDNDIDARAYMDYTKEEILANAVVAISSQAYQNAGRVNTLID